MGTSTFPLLGREKLRPLSPARARSHSHSSDPPDHPENRQSKESQQTVTPVALRRERIPGMTSINQLDNSDEAIECGRKTGGPRWNNSMKLLIWNIRGAGNNNFLNVIKEHIRMHKPQIIALLETHVSGPSADVAFFCVEACGHQGGIWLLWDKEEIHLTLIDSHTQFVTMEATQRGEGLGYLLQYMQSPPCTHRREELWDKLRHFASRTAQPWMLEGDFNETRTLEEKDHGDSDMARSCQNFSHWIENNELLDLGFTGPRFTWSRGNSYCTRKNARLDRALCNT
ncbi:hypothetical protein Cgig2_017576 [Carnegiea gigantea]|uniref:Endonuclease/exonuclease/phosphatase domain-containing protein n=1 Tax=Carnegiea gigantea TaxID=171969 RepID=A0A9Q1KM50_9CARY|nr:hypothetical protein Cgig2_017576 [Carnegiea gigantea]